MACQPSRDHHSRFRCDAVQPRMASVNGYTHWRSTSGECPDNFTGECPASPHWGVPTGGAHLESVQTIIPESVRQVPTGGATVPTGGAHLESVQTILPESVQQVPTGGATRAQDTELLNRRVMSRQFVLRCPVPPRPTDFILLTVKEIPRVASRCIIPHFGT